MVKNRQVEVLAPAGSYESMEAVLEQGLMLKIWTGKCCAVLLIMHICMGGGCI